MFELFSFQECLSAFIVLFAVIDIIGSIPIILTLKEQGRDVNPYKATLYSLALLVTFFFVGDMLLQLFQVDIASFALAGSVVIFLVALEMILDIEIFKNQGPIQSATLVPLVFPLIAGAGAFTTLLSLKSEYHTLNILIALIACWAFHFRQSPFSNEVKCIICCRMGLSSFYAYANGLCIGSAPVARNLQWRCTVRRL